MSQIIQGLGYLAKEKGWAKAFYTYPLDSGVLPVKISTLQSYPFPGL